METERDASKVDEPSGEPPDKGLAHDPTMTDPARSARKE